MSPSPLGDIYPFLLFYLLLMAHLSFPAPPSLHHLMLFLSFKTIHQVTLIDLYELLTNNYIFWVSCCYGFFFLLCGDIDHLPFSKEKNLSTQKQHKRHLTQSESTERHKSHLIVSGLIQVVEPRHALQLRLIEMFDFNRTYRPTSINSHVYTLLHTLLHTLLYTPLYYKRQMSSVLLSAVYHFIDLRKWSRKGQKVKCWGEAIFCSNYWVCSPNNSASVLHIWWSTNMYTKFSVSKT